MQLNRSANLILKSGDSKMIRNQFTILDEPRFVGFGTVDQLNGREARLSCSFNEAVDQTNVSIHNTMATKIVIKDHNLIVLFF